MTRPQFPPARGPSPATLGARAAAADDAERFAHTPGPWELCEGQLIASPDRLVCDGLTGNSADLRLIAAAPELLVACQKALALLTDPDADDYMDPAQVEVQLRAALEKAGV